MQYESSRMTGASLDSPLAAAQQQSRHQLVHCDAKIAVTENMTLDGNSKQLCQTGHSNNGEQYATRCE